MPEWYRKLLPYLYAGLLLIITSAASAGFDNLLPLNPQPAAETVKPGLAVRYVYKKVRHVNDIESAGGGEIGTPLPQLNYHSGTGNVLTSDSSDFVGAKIRGMIRFDKPGKWQIAVKSNDGVRIRLADRMILEDPDVHKDRMSPNVELTIATAGWYKLEITYFERKSTSTLELYWQLPGSSQLEIVPAAAFGYLP